MMREAADRHPEADRVELWFMDEARVGQKGRLTHVWYQKGVRPRGMRQQGFASAHLFGAVCPERGEGVALVPPEVSTAAMGVFLAELSRAVPAGTARRARARRCRLARERGAERAAEPDPHPPAPVQPRAQSGGAGVGVPARPLAEPPRARRRLRGRRGRGLPGLERAPRRARPAPLAHQLSLAARVRHHFVGPVFYARTSGFSSRSVAPSVASKATFQVPAAGKIETGPSSLVVVTNGVQSKPVAVTVK